MDKIKTLEEAQTRLEQLFETCGKRDDGLTSYIQQLAHENEQLKRSLHKLRVSKINSAAASSMHSKLSEALRE